MRTSTPVPLGLLLVLAALVLVLAGPEVFAIGIGAAPALQTWSTVFVAIVLQALPYLALGVVVGAVVTVLVPDRALRAVVPANPTAAVPVAAVAGAALPGCECGSVPLAARLVDRGVRPSAALAFMLSSPAVNPVVLVATAVAFPGQPRMVLARAVASLVVATVVGWLWSRLGRPLPVRRPTHHHDGGALGVVTHDLLHAGGFLVVGAACAATLNVAVPPTWVGAVAGVPLLSVIVLGLLAVLLAVCSEADAFVVASLTEFSDTAKLAFLVVGPAIDVKLAAMQAGTFGTPVARRLGPLTFVVAIATTLVVGTLLL